MPEPTTTEVVEGVIDPSKTTTWTEVKNSAPESSKEEVAEPKVEEPTPEKAEDPTPEASVDYVAELAKYKTKAEREKTLREYERTERKRLEKELENRSSVSEETVEVEDLDTIVERKLETIRRSEREDVISDILSDLSDNPHEQELVKTIYENKIRPSGWSKKAIQQDLEEAMLIANRGRLESVAFQKAKAKVRAGMAQERAMSDAASTGGSVGRKPPESSPGYSPNEMKWLSHVGKTKADGD